MVLVLRATGDVMDTDTAFTRIARPANEVLEFVANPQNLSLWSFGTWAVDIDATGLVRGASIKDGSVTFVRIDPHHELGLVDYHIGPDADELQPRIFIRVVAGPVFGGGENECGLTMTALRSAGMADARWNGLINTHAFEVDLIRSALETGYDHRRHGR